MSEFRKYATRVHALALETREAAQKIEEAYNRAVDARRSAGNDPVKIARAEADYQEALSAKNRWKMNKPYEIERELAGIRAELAEAVGDAFAADPAALDGATLELLKSGIMAPGEYQRLLNKAIDGGNPTMVRMIASYAEREADSTAERYGMGDDRARALRAISYQGKKFDGTVYLQNFDVLTETFNRSMRNTALFDKWEDLTGEVIEHGF